MKKSKVALGKCNIIMRVLVTNKEDLISFHFLFLFASPEKCQWYGIRSEFS